MTKKLLFILIAMFLATNACASEENENDASTKNIIQITEEVGDRYFLCMYKKMFPKPNPPEYMSPAQIQQRENEYRQYENISETAIKIAALKLHNQGSIETGTSNITLKLRIRAQHFQLAQTIFNSSESFKKEAMQAGVTSVRNPYVEFLNGDQED